MTTTAVTTKCPLCKKEEVLQVPQSGYDSWMNGGVLIQRAMPSLTPTQREQLITGICGPCWDNTFKEEEEEEE